MKSTRCFESLPPIPKLRSTVTLLLASLGLALMLDACQHCSKCSTIVIALPYVDSRQTNQPVSIEVQPSSSTSPIIICNWTSSTSAGGDWTCTKDRDGTATNRSGPRFYYNVANANTSWTITMTGPGGTRTFSQSPTMGNVGDGVLPGDCQCDTYELDFQTDDLKSVGIVTGTATGPYVGDDAGQGN
jgi:hypothetical protein